MTHDTGRKTKFDGQLKKLEGKTAQLSVSDAGASRASRGGRVSINTIGREDPTSAESLRTNILLKVIQNANAFMDLPFVRDLWPPKKPSELLKPTSKELLKPIFPKPVPIAFNSRPLNGSQKTAVEAILSEKYSRRLVLIHGPPGTGKTTVIAAAVVSISASTDTDRNLWLVAQSNVAVKNIAEKLADVGFFDFKILVSKDFHFDWYDYSLQSNFLKLTRLWKGTNIYMPKSRQMSFAPMTTLSVLSLLRGSSWGLG